MKETNKTSCQSGESFSEDKVDGLMARMTLEQKIAQLQCRMSFGAAIDPQACPDGLGEASMMVAGMTNEQAADLISECGEAIAENANGVAPIFHIETLNGVSMAGATVFPSPIGLGATFHPELIGEAAEIIHEQMGAMGYKQALSPVLDVCRDQRWGRIGETYGEDPTLNAMMGTAYVKGLQGKEMDKIAATGKHFLGYGFSAGGLNMATCMASMSEIREVYAKPFQAAITEGGLMSVMNSYGTIDGEMVISSKRILDDLLRNEMEFDGVVVSDYASIEHLVDHRIAPDMKEGGLMALKAGLDVECPSPVGYATKNLVSAVREGNISGDMIDRSVCRVLRMKEKLGLLNGTRADKSKLKEFYNPQNWETSLRAARESIVLLKNDGILPLKKEKQKIAVIGPHADNVRLLFGGYTFAAGTDMVMGGSLSDQPGLDVGVEDLAEATMKPNANAPTYPESRVARDNEAALAVIKAAYPFTKTILTCLKEKNEEAEVRYLHGCDVAGKDRSEFETAEKLARESDFVVLTVGGKYGWGGSCTVGEGIDSDDVGLTGVQEELALRLIDTKTPVIVVHMDARPFANPAVAKGAAAILENWFPGTTGGVALADVLYGDYNPAGRLSVTAPKYVGQLPIYQGQYTGNSYYSDRCQTSTCQYVDSDMKPLYYFGYGLSYTKFLYEELKVSDEMVSPDGTVTVSCRVKNIGERDGDEVVQLYVSDLQASKLRPYQEFAGCARVHLKAGEAKEVRFTIRADQFAFVGKDGKWVVEAGDMKVMVGGNSFELPLEGTFSITDTVEIRPAKRGFYAVTEIKG